MAEKPRPPKVENAPGLIWRTHKYQWEARWQARTDLVERGYPIKSWRCWMGPFADGGPDEIAVARIQDVCNALQNEMLVWGRGGVPVLQQFDHTVAGLIAAYKTDDLSGYRKLRHHSRLNYNSLMKRLEEDMGHLRIEQIKARTVHEFYGRWREGGKITMAHSLARMLRTLASFGTAFLEDEECTRLSVVLSKLRFENGKPRTVRLTTDQINALRAEAHRQSLHSIAFANAIQSAAILRQKDVIGEWVPLSEPIMSDLISGNTKWARGIQWQEIDNTFMLRHITSKKQKPMVAPLQLYTSVMEEFCRIAGCVLAELTRDKLPATGPVIINEKTGMPWAAHTFRVEWRKLATAVGIPKNVRNMDTRSGAISESIEAGASLEHARHAATHSDISQTSDYDRSQEKSTAIVAELRQKYQNKSGT